MRRLAHWTGDKLELLRVGAPLRIGPTGVLALGIQHKWNARQVFVIVTAYGDAGGTHNASPTMMLAGYVSTLGKWNRFDLGWNRAIKRAGLPGYFHSTEHWKTPEAMRFAPLAHKLEKKFILLGYVVELDKKSYVDFYIGGNRPKKPQLDTPYSVCFRFLLAFLMTRLEALLSRQDITLNIVLEEGDDGSADCSRVVHLLRKQPETKDVASIIGSLSFSPKRRWPGLQASDALAFGAMKVAPHNPQMVKVPEDASLVVWQDKTQGKPPVSYCRLDEDLLGALKRDTLALVEISRRHGACR